jgi:hypothetical protein
MEMDASALDALAREFADADKRISRDRNRIGRKAAQNIKRDWQYDAAFSRHFHQIAPTINYDETVRFGAVYEAEIGPDRRRRAARLAGIAHFGGANGGGGTLGDPQKYLDAETPNLEQHLADAAAKAVLRK